MHQSDRSPETASRWWRGKRVSVLGGAGFIGSHLVERLLTADANVRVVTRSAATAGRFLEPILDRVEVVQADCGDPDGARRAVRSCDVVVHLAATVAGIAVNRLHPATMFAENVRLVVPVFDACVAEGVQKVLYTSSACVYPGNAPIPTGEELGFVGDPEETNLGYGWAKRVGELCARFYAEEHGLQVAIVRPYNAYGPRDDFDLRTSHVIPSLIRRALEEPGGELVVWGSGRQTRSFIFVSDLVYALMLAVEKAPGAEPINIGSVEEVMIGDLARTVARLTGCGKSVVFDVTKPDGQLRRQPELRRAKEELGFVAQISLTEGLARSIEFYNRCVAAVY